MTSRREFEIREDSRRECDQAYRMIDSSGAGTGKFDLLSVGGRLLRNLGPADEALDRYFSAPFSSLLEDHYASFGINVQFEGRLRLQQQLGLRSRKTWPPPAAGGDSRNDTYLEDVIASFQEINVAEYGEAVLTTGRVASALAVIDGELWCETPPPCLAVGIVEWYPGRHQVYRQADFAWEIPGFHYGATCRRFQIDDYAGSEAYMRELFDTRGDPKTSMDNPPLPEVSRLGPAVDLNEDYEHPRRISRDLAHACVTTAFKKPDLADGFSDDQHQLLVRCKQSLLAENYLLGERFDVVDRGLDLLEIWRHLGRPKAGEVLQLVPAKLLDQYLEKTLEDTVPVNVMPRPAPLTPGP
ncbi:hypothetical protein FHT76_001523 [Rhizobium sp. BK176]|nr:hypothetical protein [Rhizobium sp. BK176]